VEAALACALFGGITLAGCHAVAMQADARLEVDNLIVRFSV
jgi:hypothetical protein